MHERNGYKNNGRDSMIPDETWDVLAETDACFKGPTTIPGVVGAPRSVAVSIRPRYDLYADARPIKTFEGAPASPGDVDFVAVREATEGMYFGKEIEIRDGTFFTIRIITKRACENISRSGFSVKRKLLPKTSHTAGDIFLLSPNTYFYSIPHKKFSRFYQSVPLKY